MERQLLRYRRFAGLASFLCLTIVVRAAGAVDDPPISFSIPAQPLRTAISEFVQQSGYSVGEGRGVRLDAFRSVPLEGPFMPREGLETLLAGTGLGVELVAARTFMVTTRSAEAVKGQKLVIADLTDPRAIEPVEPEKPRYEEIVVRSLGQGTFLFDVPATVTVFSAEDVTAARIRRIEAVFPRVPNTTFAVSGRRSQLQIAVRGISNIYGDDQPTSFLVNGVNIARGNPSPLLYDVERIEVIRGPQATSYGRNTLGGLLSIQLSRPGPDFEARVGAELARHLRGQLFGHVNVPLNDHLWLRVSGFGEAGDTGIRNLAGDEDGDAGHVGHLRTALHWQNGDGFSADLDVAYTRETEDELALIGSGALSSNADFLTGLFGVAPQSVPPFPENQRFTSHDFPNRRDMHSWFASLNLQYLGDDFAVESISGFFSFSETVRLDRDASDFPALGEIQERRTISFSEEIRVRSRGNRTLDWEFGVLSSHDRQDLGFFIGTPEIVGLSVLPVPDDLSDEFAGLRLIQEERVGLTGLAVFGSATWSPRDWLRLTAGLRYQYDRTTRTAIRQARPAVGFLPETQTIPAATNNLLPRFAVQVDLTDDLMAFVAGGRGFKPGGISGIAFVEPSIYRGESIWSFEAGLRARMLDGRGLVAVTAFYMDWNNLQVPFLETGELRESGRIFTQYGAIASGTARSRGLELELVLSLTDHLDVRGTLGYLSARFGAIPEIFIGIQTPSVDGMRMIRSPDWTASLDVEQRWDLGHGWSAMVRGEWNYRSAMVASIFAVAATAYPDVSPGRHVFNFRAGLAVGNVQLVAYVENAFNEQYYQAVDDNISTSFQGLLLQPNPRTFGVQVVADF